MTIMQQQTTADPASLEGRVAMITGSGAGMGRAHAWLMAERGADVVVQDIDAETAEATAAGVRERGRQALVFAYDIAEVARSREAVARVNERFGPGRLVQLKLRSSDAKLHAGTPDGARLSLGTLPYALPTEPA